MEMTTALWCVLVAMFLPYLFTAIAKYSRRFDNATPRQYLAETTGWRQRAHWAQLNSLETYPQFAIAVLVAIVLGGPAETVNLLAISYVGLRIGYGGAYVANAHILRTILWTGCQAIVVAIFVLSIP